jgi:hypothetical protein
MDISSGEERIVRRAVRSTWRRFRAYTTYQDLKQEAYLWILTHEEKALEWRDDGRHGENALELSLQRALGALATREKAEALGCLVDDFYQYRRGEIEVFLHGLFHGLPEATGGHDNVPPGSTVRDPLPAQLLDVERAWKLLDVKHQQLLTELLDKDRDVRQVAAEYKISVAAVHKRKARALRRMQSLLNDGMDHVQAG